MLDIRTSIPSSTTTALSIISIILLTGCNKEIQTPHGKITIKIPQKTSTGQALRLKNLGLPQKEGGYGNLNAKIKIYIPKNLTEEQIKLYKQLAELEKNELFTHSLNYLRAKFVCSV